MNTNFWNNIFHRRSGGSKGHHQHWIQNFIHFRKRLYVVIPVTAKRLDSITLEVHFSAIFLCSFFSQFLSSFLVLNFSGNQNTDYFPISYYQLTEIFKGRMEKHKRVGKCPGEKGKDATAGECYFWGIYHYMDCLPSWTEREVFTIYQYLHCSLSGLSFPECKKRWTGWTQMARRWWWIEGWIHFQLSTRVKDKNHTLNRLLREKSMERYIRYSM